VTVATQAASTPTPAQLGAANIPEAHLLDATPSIVTDRVDSLDQLPDAGINYAPSSPRAFRAQPRFGTPPGPDTDRPTAGESYTDVHMSRGKPTERQQWGALYPAGYQQPKQESLRPSPEYLANERTDRSPAIRVEIDRPRAGSIGTDPTRPSMVPTWLFNRPFDQWAEYGPAHGLPKIEQPSPLASTPLHFANPVPYSVPYAGGDAPTFMQPVGIQPNTMRIVPRAWDDLLVATGRGVDVPESVPIAGTEGQRRARGWR
jgi:hypothetical protein